MAGNQHSSRKVDILHRLRNGHSILLRAQSYPSGEPMRNVLFASARRIIAEARARIAEAPASSRRRWKCGR